MDLWPADTRRMYDQTVTGPPREQDVHPTLMPVGIPMGQTVTRRRTGSHRQTHFFGVRCQGRFHRLDDEGFSVWVRCWMLPNKHRLIESLAASDRSTRGTLESTTTTLLDAGLLIELAGTDDADWPLIAKLRVLPRAFGLGNSLRSPGVFEVRPPDSRNGFQLDAVNYAIWTTCDGSLDMETMCGLAVRDLGVSPRVVRTHAMRLLRLGIPAGLLFLDCSEESATPAETRR